MTLDLLPVGRPACVHEVVAEAGLRERLTELGFTPGTRVSVRARALLGDPLQVVVRGGAFAVRRAEARCVQVADPEPGPDPVAATGSA